MANGSFIWGYDSKSGKITRCYATPDNFGKGRCNHTTHQLAGESQQDFVKRVTVDYNYNKQTDIMENTHITFEQYKMSEEEIESLPEMTKIGLSDRDNKGGKITLNDPMWNDMDVNSFSKLTGNKVKNIKQILEQSDSVYICTDADENLPSLKKKVGKIFIKEKKEMLENKYPGKIEFGTGVLALNKAAEQLGFEATTHIYVLPYEHRINTCRKDGLEIEHELNTGYRQIIYENGRPDAKYNPQKVQQFYTALLTNDFVDSRKYMVRASGTLYKRRAMNAMFQVKNKNGPIGNMIGRKIPYSARAVIAPDIDQDYGYVTLPPTIAVNIYRPSIESYLEQTGHTDEQIIEFFNRYDHHKGVDQMKVSDEHINDLNKVIDKIGIKALFNRPPSLFDSNLLAFNSKVSRTNTVRVNPLNFEGYNADCDGDTFVAFAINDVYQSEIAINEIGPRSDAALWNSRHKESSLNKLNKEAMWGLMEILINRD